jgi:hypothetical protein
MAASHQRRTAGRARGLDIEIGQPRAFAGQVVESRCRRAAGDAAAITTELAVAKIVGKDEDDVRLTSAGTCSRCGLLRACRRNRRSRLQASGCEQRGPCQQQVATVETAGLLVLMELCIRPIVAHGFPFPDNAAESQPGPSSGELALHLGEPKSRGFGAAQSKQNRQPMSL